MSLKSILYTTLISCSLITLSIAVYHRFYAKKTAYIEIKKVFDGFQMKADLETKYKETEKARTKILDSLSLNLKIMSKHFNETVDKTKISKRESEHFLVLREEFVSLKKQFQEDNLALSQQYDNQILKRLTQYVMEFGKANDYDMIFGADGNGSLMYASDTENISSDVIAFINKNYKGVE